MRHRDAIEKACVVLLSDFEADAATPTVPDVGYPGMRVTELLGAVENGWHPDVGAVLSRPGLEVEVFVDDVEFGCPALVDGDFEVVGADRVAVETMLS